MKKLSIICSLVMVFTIGTAYAQPYLYKAAPCGTKDFTTTADVIPGGTICLDIYLTGVGGPQNAGSAVIDCTGSTADIAIVSAGRCMEDGSEGCTGPWTAGAGANVPNYAGPGSHMMVVANLGGAAPDGDGDLIVATVTLQNTGPNDATVNINQISMSGWTPIHPMDVVGGQIVISQVCYCAIDTHCDDGLFCNGFETCDAPNCTCLPGTNPCLDDGDFCNGIESCNEVNNQCMNSGNPCSSDTQCNEDNDTCDPILPAANIPTLSEWGIIFFMTIILGIGIVTLLRRRTV